MAIIVISQLASSLLILSANLFHSVPVYPRSISKPQLTQEFCSSIGFILPQQGSHPLIFTDKRLAGRILWK